MGYGLFSGAPFRTMRRLKLFFILSCLGEAPQGL